MGMLLTWCGLVLTLAGTVCAGVAYWRTWAEHGDGPFWPWLSRLASKARQLLAKLTPWKRRSVTAHAGTGWGKFSFSGEGRGSVTGPEVPAHLPVPEQVRLLVKRVERVEEQAAADRKRAQADVLSARTQMQEMAQQLAMADQAVEQMAKGLAVGTLRLQVLGLVLVGSGTLVMALPALFGWD